MEDYFWRLKEMASIFSYGSYEGEKEDKTYVVYILEVFLCTSQRFQPHVMENRE